MIEHILCAEEFLHCIPSAFLTPLCHRWCIQVGKLQLGEVPVFLTRFLSVIKPECKPRFLTSKLRSAPSVLSSQSPSAVRMALQCGLSQKAAEKATVTTPFRRVLRRKKAGASGRGQSTAPA